MIRFVRKTFLLVLILLSAGSAVAQRDPVLKQIDLPHPYYYRELYIPQLTTGPSGVTWSPDSREVIFSMQGSLWRQAIRSKEAVQLTSGPWYDYQPDWSPDGQRLVFTRYHRDAMELQLLDLRKGSVTSITSNGAVNVDPRWSPDGSRIAFVSTMNTGHLHIFLFDVAGGTITQLTRENKSELPRYYYSAFDHEISPAWSPDGSEIIFISNRNRIHGTGGFWRMKADPGSEPREIRYEETTWKAHPDWSPDGKRVIYSSYLGRQWHQLWIMTAEGGDPFPLSYGEYDITFPRWSPDGAKIAFISNESGNTSLWIQETIGGKRTQLVVNRRKYIKPTATLELTVVDPSGAKVPARVSVTDGEGRAYAPDDAWMRADDAFVRAERPFEAHYFHTTGTSRIDVPAGTVKVEVMRGFEYEFRQQDVNVPATGSKVTIQMKPLSMTDSWKGWVSGDLHVHMNYTGAYRNTPQHLIEQARAENLRLVFNLIVNKEQRIPDIGYFSGKPDPASTEDTWVLHNQEYHTSYWGHLGLLGLKENILIPDYAAYPNTPAESPYPTNAVVADLARAQGGLAGYVHPFDTYPEPAKEKRLTFALPVDAALGRVDYYETVGFSDHKSTVAVWYQLLNCGFRIPAGAGTDAMANFASLRGPVGLNRVYVKVADPVTPDRWLEALRQGRTFATNGPLLSFSLNDQGIGDEIKLPAGRHELTFRANLRSLVPVDHLQIVWNGETIREIELADATSADATGTITVDQSGWLVLRAFSDNPRHPVLDLYPYATTSPIYVSVGESPVRSPGDAAYFIAWIDRILESATTHSGYNSDREKQETLQMLREARSVYERMK